MKGQSQNQLKKRYDEAADRAASFVRREYPSLTGILVHGSVARGEPGPFSDIDLVAVTRQRKKPSEFSYFDEDIYVGVGSLSVADLEKEFTDLRHSSGPEAAQRRQRYSTTLREFCEE